MNRRPWTPAEEAQLVAQFPHMSTRIIAAMLERSVSCTYQRAYTLGLRKADTYLAGPGAGRLRPGDRRGAASRFPKGHAPWNKGAHYVAGGRSAETRFKKGMMPHNWRPVGSTRINSEGFLDIKIDDRAKGANAWTAIHRLNWIAVHGPIPKGLVLRFKDGNHRNTLVENLELVTRAEHLNRNWHGRVPLEIRQITQLRGAITRQINKRTKRHEQ